MNRTNGEEVVVGSHVGNLEGIDIIVLVLWTLLVVGIVSSRGIGFSDIGAKTKLCLTITLKGMGDVELFK